MVSCTETLHRNGKPKQLFNYNTCLENEIDTAGTQHQHSLTTKEMRTTLTIAMILASASAFGTFPGLFRRRLSSSSFTSIAQLKLTKDSPEHIYTTLDDFTGNATSNRDLQHVLTTIESAAYAAGRIALQTSGKIAIKSTKTNMRDLVTESDVKCQEVIKEIITKEFPNDKFMGEEDVDLSDDGSAVALRRAIGNVEDDCLLFIVVRCSLSY